MFLTGSQVGALFGSSMDLRFAAGCLGIGVIFGTLNSIMTYYYYAIMKPGMANLITVLRVLAVTVVLAWFLTPLGGDLSLLLAGGAFDRYDLDRRRVFV